MAVIAAISSDHFLPTLSFPFCSFLSFLFFVELQGVVGIAARQPLYVLASEGSFFAVGARNWIQFTLSLKKRERYIINYILVRVVIKHLFWVYLLKMLIGKANLKRKLVLVYTAMLENELVFLPHWGLLDRLMQGLSLCYWTRKLCLISYSIVRLQLQH